LIIRCAITVRVRGGVAVALQPGCNGPAARAIAAFPAARRLVLGLRMVVTGPRIDPESLPAADGLEVRGYAHDLYRHLAVCELI
jgi:hypothetical protein